jgi:hypothetical protein
MYYSSMLAANVSDLKKSWLLINEVLNNKVTCNNINHLLVDNLIITDPKEIAQKFNKFFTSIATEIKSTINPVPPVVNDNVLCGTRFDMSSNPIQQVELINALKGLQDKKT